MAIVGSSDETTAEPEGKLSAMAMCWIFGLGTLLSWNIICTLGDYLYELFPDYHPERVLTLAYLPLSVALLAIFVCNESKANTRNRHTVGYVLLFATNFGFLALDLVTSGDGGMGKYIGICFLVVVSSVGEAYVKGGIVGDLAVMCPEFVQSFLVGVSASGALTSIIRYPVTTFNVSDLASRYIPLIQCLKLESRKGLMMLVLSRFLFIPAFYFTARFGDQGWLIALVFLLGFTTGYPTICIMTLAPRLYKGQERNALGNVLVLSIQCGIALGVAAVDDRTWKVFIE